MRRLPQPLDLSLPALEHGSVLERRAQKFERDSARESRIAYLLYLSNVDRCDELRKPTACCSIGISIGIGMDLTHRRDEQLDLIKRAVMDKGEGRLRAPIAVAGLRPLPGLQTACIPHLSMFSMGERTRRP